jgi:hypothetical protein
VNLICFKRILDFLIFRFWCNLFSWTLGHSEIANSVVPEAFATYGHAVWKILQIWRPMGFLNKTMPFSIINFLFRNRSCIVNRFWMRQTLDQSSHATCKIMLFHQPSIKLSLGSRACTLNGNGIYKIGWELGVVDYDCSPTTWKAEIRETWFEVSLGKKLLTLYDKYKPSMVVYTGIQTTEEVGVGRSWSKGGTRKSLRSYL